MAGLPLPTAGKKVIAIKRNANAGKIAILTLKYKKCAFVNAISLSIKPRIEPGAIREINQKGRVSTMAAIEKTLYAPITLSYCLAP